MRAALAVAGGVDDHALRAVVRGGRGAVGEVLDGVDGGAVAADEEAEVLGVQRRADDALVVLLDLDLGLEGERVVDALEQVADAVGGGGGRVAHRRRPERFFFLRGGAGGGPLEPLRLGAAAVARGHRGGGGELAERAAAAALVVLPVFAALALPLAFALALLELRLLLVPPSRRPSPPRATARGAS